MAILISNYDAHLDVDEELTIGKYVLRRSGGDGHFVRVELVLGDGNGIRLVEAERLAEAVDGLFAAGRKV